MLKLVTAGLFSTLALLGSSAASRSEIIHYCMPGFYYVPNSGCLRIFGNPATLAMHIPHMLLQSDGSSRHAVLYGPYLLGNHPVAGRKY
jgi:hypothetical protein